MNRCRHQSMGNGMFRGKTFGNGELKCGMAWCMCPCEICDLTFKRNRKWQKMLEEYKAEKA